eukprot:360507-Chlamydomonas_euryale.AAC.2
MSSTPSTPAPNPHAAAPASCVHRRAAPWWARCAGGLPASKKSTRLWTLSGSWRPLCSRCGRLWCERPMCRACGRGGEGQRARETCWTPLV